MIVWLLVVVSWPSYSGGYTTYLGDFATKDSCVFVREQVVKMSPVNLKALCIQAQRPAK